MVKAISRGMFGLLVYERERERERDMGPMLEEAGASSLHIDCGAGLPMFP